MQSLKAEPQSLFHDVEDFDSMPFVSGNEVQAFVLITTIAKCKCGQDTYKGYDLLARGPKGQKHKWEVSVEELFLAFPEVSREREMRTEKVSVCSNCF